MANTTGIIVYILLIVGAVFLQIFLSKKESKWLGLILPTITFLSSLISVFGVAMYVGFSQTAQSVGVVPNIASNLGSGMILIVVYLFVFKNIPTAVLMAVYVACRLKRKRNAAIEKMSAQDLE